MGQFSSWFCFCILGFEQQFQWKFVRNAIATMTLFRRGCIIYALFAVDSIYLINLSVLYRDSVFHCCSYPMSRWLATLCPFVQAKFGEFVQCAMRAMAVMCWRRLGLKRNCEQERREGRAGSTARQCVQVCEDIRLQHSTFYTFPLLCSAQCAYWAVQIPPACLCLDIS